MSKRLINYVNSTTWLQVKRALAFYYPDVNPDRLAAVFRMLEKVAPCDSHTSSIEIELSRGTVYSVEEWYSVSVIDEGERVAIVSLPLTQVVNSIIPDKLDSIYDMPSVLAHVIWAVSYHGIESIKY